MSNAGTHTLCVNLPVHPTDDEAIAGCVKEMIGPDDLLEGCTIPIVNLDFDKNRRLIGLEVTV